MADLNLNQARDTPITDAIDAVLHADGGGPAVAPTRSLAVHTSPSPPAPSPSPSACEEEDLHCPNEADGADDHHDDHDDDDEQDEEQEEEGEEGVELPPEVWWRISAYLGASSSGTGNSTTTLRHLARLGLASRRMHEVVWAHVQTLDLSGLSTTASSGWWRHHLRHRRDRQLLSSSSSHRPATASPPPLVFSPPSPPPPSSSSSTTGSSSSSEGEEESASEGEEASAEARDPLDLVLQFLRKHSPDLRRLSLPSDFAVHHVRLLPEGLRHLAFHHVTNPLAVSAATSRLPHLTSLKLSGMHITDDLLAELPSSLTTLWVEAALSTTTTFRGTFKNLPPTLTSLHLRSCHTLVAPRFENLPSTLQVLDLNGSRGITGQKLTKLPRRLLVLNLRDCRSLMLAELAPALSRLSILRELDLQGCSIDDSVISFLPRSLSVLRLSGLITDSALALIPRQLHVLSLSNMPYITDKGLTAYLDHHFVWPKLTDSDKSNKASSLCCAGPLRSLTLAFCPKISNAGLKQIPDLGLVKLKLKGGGRKCRISEDAFQHLPATLRRLHIESAPYVRASTLSLPPSVYFVYRP